MAAPINVGDQGAKSGIGLYYVPSEDMVMAGPAFMSAFLQRRGPMADAVFAAKLKAMDPSARYNTLAQLQQERTRLLGQLAESDRNAASVGAQMAKIAGDHVDEAVRYALGTQTNQANIAVSRNNLTGEQLKSRRVTSAQGTKIVESLNADLGEARRNLNEAARSGNKQAYDDALVQLQKNLGYAKQVIEAHPNQMEKDAIKDEFQGMLSQFSGTDIVSEDVTALGQNLLPPAPAQALDTFGVGSQSYDDVVRNAIRGDALINQSGGGSSRPASPGGPVTPAAPAPPGGVPPTAPSAPRARTLGGSPPAGNPSASVPQANGNPDIFDQARPTSTSTSHTGPSYGSSAEIRQELSGVDDLIRRLQNEDPMPGLDAMARQLGTGVSFTRQGGGPARQGGQREAGKAPRTRQPSETRNRSSRSGKSSGAQTPEERAAEFVYPGGENIPDPTAPHSTEWEIGPPKPPTKKSGGTAKKSAKSEDKVQRTIDEALPRDSESDLGESPDDDYYDPFGESEQPAPKPEKPKDTAKKESGAAPGLAGVYGMNGRIPPTERAKTAEGPSVFDDAAKLFKGTLTEPPANDNAAYVKKTKEPLPDKKKPEPDLGESEGDTDIDAEDDYDPDASVDADTGEDPKKKKPKR